MLTFKTHSDLSKLPRSDPAYPTVEDLVQRLIHPDHDPEAEGFIVLIQPGDTDRVLDELWDDWKLVDIPWEGITRMGDFFWAIFLANNEYGLVFVIPDAPWVNGKLREVILENLDP